MIKLLVVDAWKQRRAGLVDALCELPGVEVRATAADASTALRIIESSSIDAVVATNDLPGSSIVTLIDLARRQGLSDILVLVADGVVLPGMAACWRELGARDVVHSPSELVARVSELGAERKQDEERRRVVASQLELAPAVAQPATVHTYASSPVGEVVASSERHGVVPQELSLGALLHDTLTRFGGVVPPEVQLHLEVGRDVPRVRCVAADVERIALLLVRGACDALPLGGKVWLCVEREGQRHVRIEVLESSGRTRAPGRDAEVLRALAKRQAGELRVVDLGGATSLQVILPALLPVPN